MKKEDITKKISPLRWVCIGLFIIMLFFVFFTYQSFQNIDEHHKIERAWIIFIESKYDINENINAVNEEIITSEDATIRINEFVQKINEAEEMLKPIFTGSDELIWIQRYKDMINMTVKFNLEQAILNPNPNKKLKTTKTQDELEVEIEHIIEENDLYKNKFLNINIILVIIFIIILIWIIDFSKMDRK